MVIVNITLKIDPALRSSLMAWIRESYIPLQLARGGVLEYRLCRLLDQDDSEGLTEVLQFMLPDQAAYRRWQELPSSSLPGLLDPRFREACVIFQTAMEVSG